MANRNNTPKSSSRPEQSLKRQKTLKSKKFRAESSSTAPLPSRGENCDPNQQQREDQLPVRPGSPPRKKSRRHQRKEGLKVAAPELLAPSSPVSVIAFPTIHSSTKKRVSFGSVQVHIHPIILSDHPCVSSGAPVGIDWECQQTINVSVDSYERFVDRRHFQRGGDKTSIRRRAVRAISVDSRSKILERAGFSSYEIAEAGLQARLYQRQRKVTAAIAFKDEESSSSPRTCEPNTKHGWDRLREMLFGTRAASRALLRGGRNKTHLSLIDVKATA